MRDDQPEFYEPGSGDPLRDFDVPHGLPRDTDAKALVEIYKDRLPFYGSPTVRGVQFANGFAELAAVALARAEFYGRLLAAQYEAEGITGLIGHKMASSPEGDLYEQSEEVRALVALEAAERDRAAALIEKGTRLGMEAKHVDAMRTYGQTVAESLKAICEELGIRWGDPATRRAAQRAVLTARERLGFELKPAAAAGPALTPAERERVRRGGA